jgi:predicted transcriptional regulator
MPSDINPIRDINKTTAHNSSERRDPSRCGVGVLLTSLPYKNKLTEYLKKNATNYRKKAGNDKMKGRLKQNQTHKGKQKATKGPIRKRKRKSTLSSSDSDDDFEEPIPVESDEDSDDDAVCPYCKEMFSTDKRG